MASHAKGKVPDDQLKKARPNSGGRQSAAVRKAKPMAKKGVTKSSDGLTGSQVLGLCALVRGETIEVAAKAAGMSLSGFKYAMALPAFKSALEAARIELRSTAIIDANGIVEKLMPALSVDIREFYNHETGCLKPMSEWTLEMGQAVQAVETEELFEGAGQDRERIGDTVKIKFWPKVEAADKIARILGLYAAEKKEVTVDVGILVVPAKTAPRADAIDVTPSRGAQRLLAAAAGLEG